MSSLFAFFLLALSLISAKIALNRSISVTKLLRMFGRIMVFLFILCIAINIILDQSEWSLISPSNLPPHYDDAFQNSGFDSFNKIPEDAAIPRHFHHRGLTAEIEDDDDDENINEDDGNEEDANSDWELPANIWRDKETFTTLSPQELEQNAEQWSMDGILPELDDPDLNQCGDRNRFFVDLDPESALKYHDQIQIWPIPQKFKLFPHRVIIQHDVQWTCNCGDALDHNELLKSAIARYESLIFSHRIDEQLESEYIHSDHDGDGDDDHHYFDSIHLVIDDVSGLNTAQIPSQDMDEHYEVIIPFVTESQSGCHSVYIHCKSVFGALRAIETLSQLILYDFDRNFYFMKYVGYIRDWPFFKYRGVLLDTSRHFHPPIVIKHFIDSIAFAKFNVFHWHFVDDQSWPFPITGSFEEFNLSDLWTKSSWSSSERYSMNDIKDIIQYANIRGIRVIPEFDVPGHVGSWCKAFDICLDVPCDSSTTSGVLDPSKPLTFKVVEAVYDAIINVFGDKMVHIGNDEANYQCFGNNTNLLEWFHRNDIASMQIEGIRSRKRKDGIKLNAVTVSKIFEILQKYTDRTFISWDDLFYKVKSVIPTDVVLMVWRPRWKKEVPKMIKRGYKMIITAPFYVDRTYEPLTDRYFANLFPQSDKGQGRSVTVEMLENQIIGGEACLWSEKVDASVLDAKLWPDAAATAENLWMGPHKIQTLVPLWNYVVRPRLKWFRCLMMERGIGFSPIDGNRTYPNDEYYLREPMYPFSCLDEEDIRPIEQRLPDNDTRAARKEARRQRREERERMRQERMQQYDNRRSINEYNAYILPDLYTGGDHEENGVDGRNEEQEKVEKNEVDDIANLAKTRERVRMFKFVIWFLVGGLLMSAVMVHYLGVSHASIDSKAKNW